MPARTRTRTPTLYATLGLPASGKSTLAKQMVRDSEPGTMARINKDDLRAMTHGFFAGKATEDNIVASRDALVVRNLGVGNDVIVDDTNIAGPHIKKLSEIAWESGASFTLLDFTDVPVEECIRRDAERTGSAKVGEKVITSMAEQLAARRPRPTILDPIVPAPAYDPTRRDVVVFDVDGTLAHMVDRRPYDWMKVSGDRPDPEVIATLRSELAAGNEVVVLSGRDGVCYDLTAAWIAEHVAEGLELIQRGVNDNRRDSIVKYELYNAHLRGRNVARVYDDRDQVVRMWRTLGLRCNQVALGAF